MRVLFVVLFLFLVEGRESKVSAPPHTKDRKAMKTLTYLIPILLVGRGHHQCQQAAQRINSDVWLPSFAPVPSPSQ